MKKGLIVALGLMALVLLSGCGNKEVNKNDGKSFDEVYGGVSFTMEELSDLEERLFPTSYTYTTYLKSDGSISDSGEYVYSSGDKDLLPVEAYLVEKEVSSSEVKNGMVYTMVDGKFENGDAVSVLYINNPETLEYAFATLYTENETILYTFKY